MVNVISNEYIILLVNIYISKKYKYYICQSGLKLEKYFSITSIFFKSKEKILDLIHNFVHF